MSLDETGVKVEEVFLEGYAQAISAKVYRSITNDVVPIVVLFHGGGFVGGSTHDVDSAAITIARELRALVISVAYSLAPDFPFPAALEDGYSVIEWVVANARIRRADPRRMAVVGHEAGGNLATCLSAVVRDRAEFSLRGQVLLAPLLDPSMTRVARASTTVERHSDSRERADNYSAYLSKLSQRMHPYAAPMESKRLTGLPPALIATSAKDVLHIEAEEYSCELINAGVPTEVIRYLDISHEGIASHTRALDDTVDFLRRKLR